ncbi:NAD(P)/FAD-dependent oxidoreductase [Caulobacter sp. X]|uniref:flavin-containing monooxygenase n=1 Tax=Caulobacter sp. X TaxID=2048901 RepID=UPI000C15B0CD|nr:NAD(P)/FAD-dependent oxidoreductase [Caulobacter sp. X]PIB95885.1 cyclohexanone monooxygenase [Caulobacter sp. X]
MAQAAAREGVETVDAVVVGAGFAGLYMVHRLREAGLSVQGIEVASDVGGTWWWNRYPGARCDIPSLLYSYTWSPEVREDWRWSEKYATQPEILAYAEHVADRYDLRRAFLFETRVTAATFDEARGRWTVETDTGRVFDAQFCVMATGCLSVPREPDIPGADAFEGEAYVTGRWPHRPVDFKGKRVAIIGTGSSGIQSMPLIAQDAAQVFVFQRTPNFSLPALNAPLSDAEVAEFKAFFPTYLEALRAGEPGIPLPPKGWKPNDAELAELVQQLWNGGGLVSTVMIPDIIRDERINAAASEFVRGKIAEIVKDRKTAEKLQPRGYPITAKRACVDTDYYASFNRDNVTLVDLRETPIETITAKGVRTTAGEIPVDIIVFALGFDAMTGALTRIDIRGRGGRLLREAWAEGPKTYLGLAVAGFPNLFTVTGPGSPSVLTNVLTAGEQHVDWIFDAIAHVRAGNAGVMEATPEAQEAWVAHVNEEADKTLFPRAASWYMGANVPGKPRVFMPYVGEDYKKRCDRVAAEGYAGFALS